jgi:hypothetical protein
MQESNVEYSKELYIDIEDLYNEEDVIPFYKEQFNYQTFINRYIVNEYS